MKIFKRGVLTIILGIAMLFNSITAFADSTGDPNIDSGGGGMGNGSSTYYWNPTDDGVRITIVDARTGAKKSASIDYTNKSPNDISCHFGKVSKSDYKSGAGLTPSSGKYQYINPAQALPTIVSDGEYWFSSIGQENTKQNIRKKH